jgi:hypothetical protein
MLQGTQKNVWVRRFKKDLKRFKISHPYTKIKITPNMNKRTPIYNKDNIIIDSIPLRVINNKLHKNQYNIVSYNPNKYAISPHQKQ